MSCESEDCEGGSHICWNCGGEGYVEPVDWEDGDEEPCGHCGGRGGWPCPHAIGRQLVMHPLPIPCKGCGTILQATYAEKNDFCCPVCKRPVCYACGCVEHAACAVEVCSADGSRSAVYTCSWAEPGMCSFCMWRAAYEFYQEATGRPATDPFYMNLGRSVRAVLGLGHGV